MCQIINRSNASQRTSKYYVNSFAPTRFSLDFVCLVDLQSAARLLEYPESPTATLSVRSD